MMRIFLFAFLLIFVSCSSLKQNKTVDELTIVASENTNIIIDERLSENLLVNGEPYYKNKVVVQDGATIKIKIPELFPVKIVVK